ncbi:hypothetical protein MBM_05319 [Drepanopeziza brunnea f. sp. 'multigermtubi' MB_m1]|uniref:Uncharacterized protein n=1 Tax=Marssonina brunnea f. sp. multigermtubi (strain MB_m1) TaxID=1072389 RepID=K1WGZ3_MARBU|nr:uncharacterized protein MBM_05319 [Drepanopeziza brunnea f. sp. 'multigermtubi' MB_m1]EKD16850.1 hypothetical protein MBM_05319 [Drepanopeziza brunnea f. sp. 'multigermtubi' MB_m1]
MKLRRGDAQFGGPVPAGPPAALIVTTTAAAAAITSTSIRSITIAIIGQPASDPTQTIMG